MPFFRDKYIVTQSKGGAAHLTVRKKFKMSKTQRYRRQITSDMDQLQASMESQQHIQNPTAVACMLESLSTRWTFLTEEDRDYVQGCQHALEEGVEWNVNH